MLLAEVLPGGGVEVVAAAAGFADVADAGETEVHSGDGEAVGARHVEDAGAGGGCGFTIGIKDDACGGVGELHWRCVDDVAPDEHAAVAGAEQVAGVSWGVAGQRHGAQSGRDVGFAFELTHALAVGVDGAFRHVKEDFDVVGDLGANVGVGPEGVVGGVDYEFGVGKAGLTTGCSAANVVGVQVGHYQALHLVGAVAGGCEAAGDFADAGCHGAAASVDQADAVAVVDDVGVDCGLVGARLQEGGGLMRLGSRRLIALGRARR